jgi:hypothetical protein
MKLWQAWRTWLPHLHNPGPSKAGLAAKEAATALRLNMGAARVLRVLRRRVDHYREWQEYRQNIDSNRRRREARR